MPAWLDVLKRNRTAALIAGAGGVAGLALLMAKRNQPGSDEDQPTSWTYQDPGAVEWDLDQRLGAVEEQLGQLEGDDRPRPQRPPSVPTGPAGPTGPNRNPGPRAPAPPPRPKPRPQPTPAPKRKPRIYTVRAGDTLAEIAQRYRIKSGARGIYAHPGNRTRIEAAARRHGYKSSRNGALIFPGTKLWLGMR